MVRNVQDPDYRKVIQQNQCTCSAYQQKRFFLARIIYTHSRTISKMCYLLLFHFLCILKMEMQCIVIHLLFKQYSKASFCLIRNLYAYKNKASLAITIFTYLDLLNNITNTDTHHHVFTKIVCLHKFFIQIANNVKSQNCKTSSDDAILCFYSRCSASSSL